MFSTLQGRENEFLKRCCLKRGALSSYVIKLPSKWIWGQSEESTFASPSALVTSLPVMTPWWLHWPLLKRPTETDLLKSDQLAPTPEIHVALMLRRGDGSCGRLFSLMELKMASGSDPEVRRSQTNSWLVSVSRQIEEHQWACWFPLPSPPSTITAPFSLAMERQGWVAPLHRNATLYIHAYIMVFSLGPAGFKEHKNIHLNRYFNLVSSPVM